MRLPALLSAPFRPFFLAAALHAMLAMSLWALFLLNGSVLRMSSPDPFLWHGHTMVVGFAGAVIAGFLLTAAANWTGRPTTTPSSLLIVLGLWLLGRSGDYAGTIPGWAALFGDVGFWLLLVVLVLRVIVASGNWRNLGFALLPLAFGAVDLAWHLDVIGVAGGIGRAALWTGVDLLAVIMGAMGGRIIPFFTSRRLMQTALRNPSALAMAANVALISIVPANWFFRGERFAAWVMFIAGILLLVRLAGWRSHATRREPLLWILHVGFFWLGTGLLLRAIAIFTGAFAESTALHAITVGALGALGLGMLVRVALGHTGRLLQAPTSMVVAFVLVVLAALARLTSLIHAPSWLSLGASSALWAVAFALYLAAFARILTQPRPTA